MTKLTFDVDFNKDPEEILREIQERAQAEVAKRASKAKSAAYLSKLHEKVNEELGTNFKNINELIRALSQHANPKLRDKMNSTSSSGRRTTISMSQSIFDEIKSKLAKESPNKAAIARETGVSVVQVRKVAAGGYDKKFGSGIDLSSSKNPASSSVKELTPPPPIPEVPAEEPAPLDPPPAPSLELPPAPSLPEPAPSPVEELLL